MRSVQRARKKLDALEDICVAEEARIEFSVEDGSVGSDLERAAEKTAVGHGDHQHSAALHTWCAGGDHVDAAVDKELTQR